jgi:hypothetical protein
MTEIQIVTVKPGNNRGNKIAHRSRSSMRNRSTQLLPALIAGSACGLMSGPSSALQLGDIEIQSSLGQPLRASIAFALAPNEQLQAYCISLNPGLAAGGLPALSRANVTLANGRINLTGIRSVREPIIALQVVVDCPYVAHLTRSYTIMLDPAKSTDLTATAPTQQSENSVVDQVRTTTRAPTLARTIQASVPPVETTPIALGTAYRVQAGDTVSEIASRIENRPIGLWPAVNAIFVANPDAFIGGDIDRIKAGSEIVIPAFDGNTKPVLAARTDGVVSVTESPEATNSSGYNGYVPDEILAVDDAAGQSSTGLVDPEPVITVDAAPDAASLPEVQPGNISFESETILASPIASPPDPKALQELAVVVTPPAASLPVPGVPVVSGRSTVDTGNPWSGVFWLAGFGTVALLGWLTLGRRIRDKFSSSPIGASIAPARHQLDEDVQIEGERESKYRPSDTPEVEKESNLDTDLGTGKGLGGSSDTNLAQNAWFVASEEPTILDTEILPVYEIANNESTIADAIQDGDSSITENDLKVVPIDELSVVDDKIEFTLDEPIGAEFLERDYEDELSATQAACLELELAAKELDAPDNDQTEVLPEANLVEVCLVEDEVSLDHTVEMPAIGNSTSELIVQLPVATDITSEFTAKLPSLVAVENDCISDLDDTGVNPEIKASFPAAENDATAEMEEGPDRLKSKKSVG